MSATNADDESFDVDKKGWHYGISEPVSMQNLSDIAQASVALVKAKMASKGKPMDNEPRNVWRYAVVTNGLWFPRAWTKKEAELYIAVKQAGLL